MKLKRLAAVKCAQMTRKLIKRLRKGNGAAFPGLVARILDPAILSEMASMVREKTIAVMGTNGKTTTTALIYQALTAKGYRVITNATGANMYNGIVSAFVLAAEANAGLCADYACIEVDEIASVKVLPKLRPSCIVLTNLSEDQMDRLGDVTMTLSCIQSAFDRVPEATLLLNADDPVSCSLKDKCKNPSVTFGITGVALKTISTSAIPRSAFCSFCGAKLQYDYRHYGLLGGYRCPACGFSRPDPDYSAEDITFSGKSYKFTLWDGSICCRVKTAYGIYNTLAAYACLRVLSLRPDQFAKVTESFDYGNQREKIYIIEGKKFQVHLAKNPAGFRQKLSLVLNDPTPKDIVVLINDTPADGEDISWIWNVDFQKLKWAHASSIVAAGMRYCDVGLRFKYEDIPFKTAKDVREALLHLLADGTDNIYVIVNYSGLFPINHILKTMQSEAKK